jgi:hypothetical protein
LTDKEKSVTDPVSFIELNTPDLERSRSFFADVFGWDPQPFAAPDYLVSPAGARHGIDAALLTSRDGQPRAVPIVNVTSLDVLTRSVAEHGGTVVVDTFTIPGVGRGCYITDPTGLLVGIHENDPSA